MAVKASDSIVPYERMGIIQRYFVYFIIKISYRFSFGGLISRNFYDPQWCHREYEYGICFCGEIRIILAFSPFPLIKWDYVTMLPVSWV